MKDEKEFVSVADLLREYDIDNAVWRPVHGGDINDSYMVTGSNGNRLFIKANSVDRVGMFKAEAESLWALASPGIINTPEVLGYGKDKERQISFLALSFVESKQKKSEYWKTLGDRLWRLHRADVSFLTDKYACQGVYGFITDNYLGSTKQINTPCETWAAFYRDYRLLPQLKIAEKYFSKDVLKAADFLLSYIDRYITEPEFPSLLHGDLWGGNVLCGDDGDAMLIDPAAYVGHYEADIAMTELFGGFNREFYEAYTDICPLDNGYRECRRDIYQLYHLLNHLNLFGKSYLADVERILLRYGSK